MSNNTGNMSQYDKMTKTPIPILVSTLAVPTIMSMLITSIYNMADTAFVGRLGTSQSGAVGVVFAFMAILQAGGFMFGQGAGSIVSRQLGAGENEKASVTLSTAFFSAMAVGIVLEVAGFVFMDPLVYLLGSTETIEPYARQYMVFILIAAPFMTSSCVLNNVLRFEGKASLGTIGMMTGSILNIIIDPIFIFVFDMGVMGAGFATGLSQIISFCILLSMFLRHKATSHISIRLFNKEKGVFLDIIGTGFPSLLRQGLASVATMILNNEAKIYGDAAVAAMSIVSRIVMLIFSVALGIGQGFQPVSGFNYGAKIYSRVKKGFAFTLVMATAVAGILSAIVALFAPTVITFFRNDPDVVAVGVRALRLQCFSMLFLPSVMVSEMLLQSTGQKLAASALSALRGGGIFIPLLLVLSWFRGLSGIQEAQPLSNIISIIPAIIAATIFIKNLPADGRTALSK